MIKKAEKAIEVVAKQLSETIVIEPKKAVKFIENGIIEFFRPASRINKAN